MYLEIPKISRCCFCVPLRYGLQVWGYIKLILEVAFTIFAFVKLWPHLIAIHFLDSVMFILLTFLVDIIFSVLLVIATHKKNERLFKFYYIYSIVITVWLIGDIIINTVSTIMLFYDDSSMFTLIDIAKTNVLVILGFLLIQGYIIFLVRSELVKLRDRSNVQFYNHTSSDANNQKVAVNLP